MTTAAPTKPLGQKSYGHIPHLPGSRLGPGDHHCHAGQARIATEKARDQHDVVIVQEKLDGSNVSVARLDGKLYPLTRAGYLARHSPYEQHWRFDAWVWTQQGRFLTLLKDGERLCGEWLLQAHGTRYALPHEPFVAFDLMRGSERTTFTELVPRVSMVDFVLPILLSYNYGPLSIPQALARLDPRWHGALDPIEGAVWRVERHSQVDFLAKYVRPDMQPGRYLPELSGQPPIWNTYPEEGTP